MEIIQLPFNMDLDSALGFCLKLESLDYNKTTSIGYEAINLGTVEPFGMLLVGAKIREMKKRYGSINYKYRKLKDPHSYAGHMGFFRSIGMEYGSLPGSAVGSNRYAPISKLQISAIEGQARTEKKHVGEIVESHAWKLARILYAGDDKCIEHMTYAIREIMRNVVEHSKAQTIWYAGQAWPSKNLVEIAILDEGVGVFSTINSNRYYSKYQHNNLNALKFSLEPGITQTFSPNRKDDEEDGWINTGFGLYMTSNICKTVGSFAICSGDHAICKQGDQENLIQTSFNGTAIRMRFRLSDLSMVTALRSKLVREGEGKARKNTKLAIMSASKASKLNCMTQDGAK